MNKSLPKLIKLCGDKFHKLELLRNGKWRAWSIKEAVSEEHKTFEEAVDELRLKINNEPLWKQ